MPAIADQYFRLSIDDIEYFVVGLVAVRADAVEAGLDYPFRYRIMCICFGFVSLEDRSQRTHAVFSSHIGAKHNGARQTLR